MTAIIRALPQTAPAEDASQDVITLLENMLVSARRGDTIGVLAIEVTKDPNDQHGHMNTFYQAGYRQRYSVIGYLTRIIHELNTQP